eukprot:2548127-Prorocentrum_lima.AAC.1
MDISATISAVLRGEVNRTAPWLTGHESSMQVFLSPAPMRTKISSKAHLWYDKLPFDSAPVYPSFHIYKAQGSPAFYDDNGNPR